MKRGIITVIIAFAACLIINGQVDYKSKGLSYVANGNYEEAQSQFEAAKAVLQSKKVNQNAPEFIDIEKKISYAKQCQAFSKQASKALNELTDSTLQDAFIECNSESDADQIQESLLATLEKAKNALKNIKSKFPNDKVADANLDKCTEIQSKINGFRESFSEIQAWKRTLAANSIPAFEEFLDTYPSGNYSDVARAKITEFKDVLAWAEVSSSGNYESYVQYLKSYPDGIHAEEAKKYVNQMEDEMCWSENNDIGTTDSYKDYISRYPSGKHITYAKQRLAKCQERDYWEAQSAKNTVAAYKSYLSKYPKGSYAAAAQNGIDKIGEASAWAKAEQENTIEGYQAYLNASKKKAFKKEAEAKIAAIKHEQEVNADESLWAKIKNASVSTDFENYLNSNDYKGHEKEARFKYNILKAREYPMDIVNANAIVSAFGEASKYGSLDIADKSLLNEAKELSSYGNFLKIRSMASAKQYLNSYPQGIHATDVSNAYSKMLADGMTMTVSESEYQNAISYAVSRDAKAYVDKKYHENTLAYKKYQRSLKVEPCHFLIGVEGAVAGYPYGTVLYSDEDKGFLDLGIVASIGGHSNLFNFELGYSIVTGYVSARPRINLVKKKYQGKLDASNRSGSDYSVFDLFIAPEFNYFVYAADEYSMPYTGTATPTAEIASGQESDPFTNTYTNNYDYDYPIKFFPQIDYGIRGGFGIGSTYGTIELFGGYRVKGKYGYVGLSWFFGNK